MSELELEDDLELFPKQDELREDRLGNMVRGPLGIHRGCGERFPFLDLSSLAPVGSNLAEQLDYLMDVETVSSAQVAQELARLMDRSRATQANQAAKLAPKRRGASEREGHGEGLVEVLKREIGNDYTFISQFVELEEKGQGHWPFHPRLS